jgi:hypothetical protein
MKHLRFLLVLAILACFSLLFAGCGDQDVPLHIDGVKVPAFFDGLWDGLKFPFALIVWFIYLFVDPDRFELFRHRFGGLYFAGFILGLVIIVWVLWTWSRGRRVIYRRRRRI